jgi:DNA topoisomerase-1
MQKDEEQILAISKRKIKTIIKNPVKTAQAINLIYVSNTEEGIIRIKKGQSFHYIFRDKKITDEEELKRIHALVIPPAWENVWICKSCNGHLQATGLDAKKRLQYKYHHLWNALRNHTKFYRLAEFGKSLPKMRMALEQHISTPGLHQQKVLATVVSVMERTHIRVGNNFYEKLYGSFGLTTLKDKHVQTGAGAVRFTFKGKKGVHHDIELKNKKLARIVQQCKDIPGKELFQYYDDNNQRHAIDSGMVNEYIKTISENDFTAKDFRTWAGSVHALTAFKNLEVAENKTAKKKNMVTVLDEVSQHLGNTRTVCKKYYVHPLIMSLYEEEKLHKYFDQLNKIETDNGHASLTAEEKILMKILES